MVTATGRTIMAVDHTITVAGRTITAVGHTMAAAIIVIVTTRVSGPRPLIALDPGLGAIGAVGTSSQSRSRANGASVATIMSTRTSVPNGRDRCAPVRSFMLASCPLAVSSLRVE